MPQFCLLYQQNNSPIWSRQNIDSSVAIYRNSLFSKDIDIAINSKVSPPATGKVIKYVSTSPFTYVCRSQSLLSKLNETLLRGK
jgi:hypothetical protein